MFWNCKKANALKEYGVDVENNSTCSTQKTIASDTVSTIWKICNSISLNSYLQYATNYVSYGVYLNLKPCTGLRVAGALYLHFFARNLHPMAQHPMKVNNNTIPIRIIDDSKTVISIGFQQFLASIIGAMTFPYLIVSVRSRNGVAISILLALSYRMHLLWN